MKNKIYKDVDSDFKSKFIEEVKTSSSIAIATHKSPDDDAVGSVLSIYYYLVNELNISENKINMYISWKKVDRWDGFKHGNKIKYVDDISNNLDGVQHLIILDASGWDRISDDEEISKKQLRTICIDHHPKPSDVFDLHLVAEQYTSTTETIYRLFYQDTKLNKDVCQYILIGILGDTGYFTYIEPHDIEVFDIVKKLVKEGDIHIETMMSEYSNIAYDSHAVLSELLKNSKVNKVAGWPDHIISYLSESYAKKNRLDQYKISEAIEVYKSYLKSTKGIGWGIIASPIKLGTKMSGRSIPGSVSIRDIFEKMGKGGGHDRAAGATFKGKKPQEAIAEVVDWLSNNKPVYK